MCLNNYILSPGVKEGWKAIDDVNHKAKHAYASAIVELFEQNGMRFIFIDADENAGTVTYPLASPEVKTVAVKWCLRRKSGGRLI